MTWTLLAPVVVGKAPSLLAPVIATCNPKARFRQTLKIVVRGPMPPRPTWWEAGTEVRVMVGEGGHAGKLMLSVLRRGVTGPAHTLIGIGPKARSIVLRLHDFPELPTEGAKQTVLAWRIEDDALQVDLPSWVEFKRPFVGLGSTGHTETFAARRGGSPVR